MNYWDYVRVEDLLALQNGCQDDDSRVNNDETLFIVVHQVYELWFKLVLRELDAARTVLRQNPVPDVELAAVVRGLRRVNRIFEVATHHFAVVETLTTRDYLGFRDRLIPASGFQSAQLREIEIVLGLDDARRIPLGQHGFKEALRSVDGTASPALHRVEKRLREGPSFKDALYAWLARTPIDGSSSPEAVDAFLGAFLARHRAESTSRFERAQQGALPGEIPEIKRRYDHEVAATQAFLLAEDLAADPSAQQQKRAIRAAIVFLESYRELPRLAWAREVVDAVVEMEQGFVLWRQRHARMVERVIGRRVGTGGSAGVDYLDQTALKYRVFDDVWAVRTLLLRQGVVPTLVHADDYRFRVEDHPA